MATKIDQFSEIQRKNMEAAMRLAQLSIENSQRVMALQSELARELFQHGVDNAKAQTTAKDPAEIMKLRAEYAQETTQKMMEAAQQIAEVGNEARAEFSRLLTEQLAAGSQEIVDAFQGFFKSLPNSNSNVMETMQQAMATANSAFEQIAKATTAAMENMSEATKKASGRKK
jgi:phasin family protein